MSAGRGIRFRPHLLQKLLLARDLAGRRLYAHLFGRLREKEEISGISEQVLLVRAADDQVHENGQDGGLVSAILIWLLDEGYIDGALVSYLEGDGSTWKAKPGVATTKEEVLAAAKSL